MSYLIRHIDTSYDGDIFAAAEFENTVYIWSFDGLQKLVTLMTKLDFGGKRLSIAPNGDVCAVGAYNRYGITMYDLSKSQILWNNKELKKVQRLKFNVSGDMLYACFDDKPMHVIDSKKGDIIDKVKGVKDIWFSPYSDIYLQESDELNLHNLTINKKIVINRKTFAVLDVTFSDDIVFISESGGPLRAVSIIDGRTLWEIEVEDSHFLRLGYCEEINALFAVIWSYIDGGNKILYKIDKNTGNILSKTEFEQDVVETEFIKKATYLVNSNGSVYKLCGAKPEIIDRIEWI